FFGAETIENSKLNLPHKSLFERAFVLIPLAEIAPSLKISGRSVAEAAVSMAGEAIQKWEASAWILGRFSLAVCGRDSSAAAGRRPKGRRQMAQAGRAKIVSPFWLCWHGQNNARQKARRGRRWRGRLWRLHWQGGSCHARNGLRRRAHHSQPDLSRERNGNGRAYLCTQRGQPSCTIEARHRRRMFHGRCGTRSRSFVLRQARFGSWRSGSIASHKGRRIFHQRRS